MVFSSRTERASGGARTLDLLITNQPRCLLRHESLPRALRGKWTWRESNPRPNLRPKALYMLIRVLSLFHDSECGNYRGHPRQNISGACFLEAFLLQVPAPLLLPARDTAAIRAKVRPLREAPYLRYGELVIVVSNYCLVSDLGGVHRPPHALLSFAGPSKPGKPIARGLVPFAQSMCKLFLARRSASKKKRPGP